MLESHLPIGGGCAKWRKHFEATFEANTRKSHIPARRPVSRRIRIALYCLVLPSIAFRIDALCWSRTGLTACHRHREALRLLCDDDLSRERSLGCVVDRWEVGHEGNSRQYCPYCLRIAFESVLQGCVCRGSFQSLRVRHEPFRRGDP